jgi:hypothetical protein
MEKLYIVCRNDLPPGAQVAQSCHALAEFARFHPKLFNDWMTPEQHNIVCLAASQDELDRIFPILWDEEIPVARFHESDLGAELTALAVAESGAKLLSHLPLALRQPRPTPLPSTLVQKSSGSDSASPR